MARPSAGNGAGAVEACADRISREEGRLATRNEVLQAPELAGLSPARLNLDYGHWKRGLWSGEEAGDGAAQPGWQYLRAHGFGDLASWQIAPEGGLILDGAAPESAGLFAFALGEEVVYIGATRRPLAARMADLRHEDLRRRASARLHRLILESLMAGQAVRVLFATPEDTLWNGLPMVVASGLEAGLIEALRPVWNRPGG